MDAEQILRYWFGEDLDRPEAVSEQSKLWFRSDATVDAYVRKTYLAGIREVAEGGYAEWREHPRSMLALILLMDQFPRNIFRGTGEAFAFDARARELTSVMLDRSWDAKLHPVEAVFVYLPLEHSESLVDQDRCVGLFRALRNRAPEGMDEHFAGYVDYAIAHRDIIAQFGRFPHRNEVLGRGSTDSEKAFLASGDHSFGQG